MLIKRRSEAWNYNFMVQEKNMSCERALNFHQCKTCSKNYKPIRV